MYATTGCRVVGTRRRSSALSSWLTGHQVELVVPEDKATEMVANRMLTYVVAKAVAEAWGAHGGYHDVQVVFSYVPAFKEPVAFAVGLTTPTGFRVHMSEN